MSNRASAASTILVLVLSLLSTGCAYRGAIYASYQEAGLGIKMTAESDAPVKVHFGYNRGVGAWVPRRGGDDEEATSLISRDDIRAGVNPTKLDQPLLQADGVMISGTAAIVASAPADAIVTVREGDSVLEVQTEGTAGERLETVLSPVGLSDEQATQRSLILETARSRNGDAIFKSAAAKMSERFQELFQQRLASGDSVSVAFKRSVFTYEGEADDSRPRVSEVVAALQAAR